MSDHLRTAHEIADVAWLARSRRAYGAWPARLGALLLGCGLMAGALELELAAGALVLVTVVGCTLAGAGLVCGAVYGRVVGGLTAALDVGYSRHWLEARVAAREGAGGALALELEELADRQPV